MRKNTVNVLLTLVEAIIIHGPIHVQILSSHKRELCFRMLIWSIVRVITVSGNVPLLSFITATLVAKIPIIFQFEQVRQNEIGVLL